MSEKRQFFKKRDIIIILAMLFAAIVGWVVYSISHGGVDSGLYAEIYWNGELKEKVYLSDDKTFSIEGLPAVEFEIKDNSIAFISSDCPDRLCIHMGRQSGIGGFAACLPNGVMLWVESEDGGKVDAVTR